VHEQTVLLMQNYFNYIPVAILEFFSSTQVKVITFVSAQLISSKYLIGAYLEYEQSGNCINIPSLIITEGCHNDSQCIFHM
jgi:hypothetical protein